MRKLPISWAGSRFDREMHFREISWTMLKAKLSAPVVTADTFSEYLTWSREQQTQSKDVGYYIVGQFADNLRHNAEFERRGTVTLDIDYPKGDFEQRLLDAFGEYEFFWHTSRKSSPNAPRVRVHLPLSRDVTSAEEYEALTRHMASLFGFDEVDRVSFIPAQMMFWPSVCSDGVFQTGCNPGDWLDPDFVLGTAFMDWRNRAEWPRSENEAPPETRKDKVDSPLSKPGVIGAWCRAFSITRCLEEIIPGVYEPSGSETRWRYTKSEGGTGAVVYDRDTAIYSHHTNHDPIAGRSTNAFDLVRIHKFGELDAEVDPLDGLTPTQMPSFIEMTGFAMTFDEVVAELDRTAAYDDFEDEPEALASAGGEAPPPVVEDEEAWEDDLPGEKPLNGHNGHNGAGVNGKNGHHGPAADELGLGPGSRIAEKRLILRQKIDDCEQADDLEDKILPAIVGASLTPSAETLLLQQMAERHKQMTGLRMNLPALRKTADNLRRRMLAREERSGGQDVAESDLPGVELTRNEDGEVLNTVDNIIHYLEAGSGGYTIGFDTFLATEMLSPDGAAWKPFRDTDYTRLRRALERFGFKSFGGGNELIRQAVALIAEEHTFDSAQAWLRGLMWDGVPRIEQFVARYLGGEDSAYSRAVGRYIWSAMAGRVLRPGAKADMMPILYGPQGARKTTIVGSLVPDEQFHCRVSFKNRDDDTLRKMAGKLVAEVPELRGMNTADEEGIKGFLDATHDEWVPKFKEKPLRMGRRLIFFGSVDKPEFLSDIAGNRRYLPVSVGVIDVETLAAEREQLWAEGAELFARLGHVDYSAEKLARPVHAQHTISDGMWDDKIEAWLEQPASMPDFESDGAADSRNGDGIFTVADVLEGALREQVSRAGKAEEMRIGRILVRLGYERGTFWDAGVKRARKAWRRSQAAVQ